MFAKSRRTKRNHVSEMITSDEDDEEPNDEIMEKIVDKLRSGYPSYFEIETNMKRLKSSKWMSILKRLESERDLGYDTDLETVRSHNFRTFILMKVGRTDEAREANEDALRLQENNVCALVSKGMLFCSEQSTLEAEEVLQQLSDLERNAQAFASLKAEAEGELAFAYSRMSPKFYGQSIQKFNAALQQCPKYIWKFGLALVTRRCLHMSNVCLYPVKLEETRIQVRQAAEDLVDIMLYAPDTHGSLKGKACVEVAELLNLVQFYPFLQDFKPEVDSAMKQKLGREWTMLELLKRARELAPKSEFVLEKCGKYLRYEKQYDEAREHLESALSIRPTSFAHHHLGLVFRAQAFKNAWQQKRQSDRGDGRGRGRGRGGRRGQWKHRGRGRDHRQERHFERSSFRGQGEAARETFQQRNFSQSDRRNPIREEPFPGSHRGDGRGHDRDGYTDHRMRGRDERGRGSDERGRGRHLMASHNVPHARFPLGQPYEMANLYAHPPQAGQPHWGRGAPQYAFPPANTNWGRGGPRRGGGGRGYFNVINNNDNFNNNNNNYYHPNQPQFFPLDMQFFPPDPMAAQFHLQPELRIPPPSRRPNHPEPSARASVDYRRLGLDQDASSQTEDDARFHRNPQLHSPRYQSPQYHSPQYQSSQYQSPQHQSPSLMPGATGGPCETDLALGLENLSLNSDGGLFGDSSQGSQGCDSGLGTMSPTLLSQDTSTLKTAGVEDNTSLTSPSACEGQLLGVRCSPDQEAGLTESPIGGQKSGSAASALDPEQTCLMTVWTPPPPGQQLAACGVHKGRGFSTPERCGSNTPSRRPGDWIYKKTVKSPHNEVTLSLEDEHVREAIQHFNKAFDISETNVRALYDLGLIHKAAGDYEGALKFFKKIVEINLNNQTPMDQANAREQIGLCYLALARAEDAPLKRERLMEMASRELQTAIRVQCQAAMNIQGMSVESTWNSFSTLKALIEDDELSSTPVSKLKELARLHELIGSHHKAISCYDELRKLDESEWNSVETMEKMIGTYSSVGRHCDSIHLFNLLCSFSPADKRKEYSKIAIGVYLDAAKASHKKGDRAEMTACLQSLFSFFNPPAEESELEEDLWDVMILHEDSDDLGGDGERLETALDSMCGLRVTRNDNDLLRGQSDLDIIGVMERCKCLVFLLDHTPLSDRMTYLMEVALTLLHDDQQADSPLSSINVVTTGEATQVPRLLRPCPRVSCPSSALSEGSPECLENVLELMRTIVTKQKVRKDNTAVKTVD